MKEKRPLIDAKRAVISFGEFWRRYYLLILIVVLLIVSSLLHKAFFTKENIMNVLAANATIAMVALGMFFVIVAGGIDLSVGSIIAFSCTLLARSLQGGMPWWFAIGMTIMVMTIPGLTSGALVAYGGIPPFMATLAMMTIMRGLAYIYQVGSPRLIFDKHILFLGTGALGLVPMPFVILVALFIPATIVLGNTPFGKKLYAIGGNARAAHLSGIRVRSHVVATYIISSIIAALAGIVLGARLMMGAAIFGAGYELDAIASVVIGGASLNGGSGNALNVVLGAFVFGFIANILNLLGVSSYAQMVVKGLIIFIAVLASRKGSEVSQ